MPSGYGGRFRSVDTLGTMALYHQASISPTKAELLAEWVPAQAWSPESSDDFEVVGAFRFDDPAGQVGIETHLVRMSEVLLQVPLTYRDSPLEASSASLIGTMEHSALGTRWVYDGLGDPLFLVMVAAVAMTGQGEALGMIEVEGRWRIAPTPVRIEGGGWTQERVPVDGFQLTDDDGGNLTYRNDGLELSFFRRPQPAPRPAMGLTAVWPGQAQPVLLAAVRDRRAP